MSDAAQHLLSYVAESTRGTTPTNPRFRRLPDTRVTGGLAKDVLPSNRITGTRIPAEPRHGAKSVSLEIPVDLSAIAYDDFLASAFQGTWTETGGTDTITIEQDAVSTASTDVGDTFSTTNGTVTVEHIDARAERVDLRYDPTAGGAATTYQLWNTTDTVTIDGDVFQVTLFTDAEEIGTLLAGETRQAFSILREFTDLGGGTPKPFLLYKGCEVNTFSLQATANGIVTGSFSFFGQSMDAPATAAPTNTDYAPEFSTVAFDTFSGDAKIDGVSSSIVVDFSLTVNNNIAARYAVGVATSRDPSNGDQPIEGNVTLNFENADLYEKFVNDTSFSLEFEFKDATDREMTLTLPNCRVGSGVSPDVSAQGDINISIPFTAHNDVATGSHAKVVRKKPTV